MAIRAEGDVNISMSLQALFTFAIQLQTRGDGGLTNGDRPWPDPDVFCERFLHSSSRRLGSVTWLCSSWRQSSLLKADWSDSPRGYRIQRVSPGALVRTGWSTPPSLINEPARPQAMIRCAPCLLIKADGRTSGLCEG